MQRYMDCQCQVSRIDQGPEVFPHPAYITHLNAARDGQNKSQFPVYGKHSFFPVLIINNYGCFI